MAGECPNLSNLTIESASGNYDIAFEKFSIRKEMKSYFIIDSYFKGVFEIPDNRVIYVEAKEESKNLAQVEKILISLSNIGMTKKDELVVIGGGFVQDIGTLVSSLYMRGVEWIFVPTTLAAMGDSCIGGKSSINAGSVKNLVGNFNPPRSVLIDTGFCHTLPILEIIAGIAEIIKICFAHSIQNFIEAARIASIQNVQHAPLELDKLVLLSLESKKYFVEEDEFDTGIRKKLNFGHSFGHALEAASAFQIPHGVAVMLGMIAATDHPAASLSPASKQLRDICFDFLGKVTYEISDLLGQYDAETFKVALKKDKKNTPENLILILPGRSDLTLHASAFTSGAIEIAQSAMEKTIMEVLNEIR